MNTNSRGSLWAIIIVIVLVVVVGIAIYATSMNDQAPATAQTATSTADTQNIQVTFTCDAGKFIDAMFMNASTATTTGNQVMLTLSDGRQLTLPQTISADGARYANADESFVFWNVGDTATVTENGTSTYSNCVDQNNQ